MGHAQIAIRGRDGQKRPARAAVPSDGADTGTRIPALAEVGPWRRLSCPVHTFAYGKPTTPTGRADVIAITAIAPEPSPVPVKGKLIVKVLSTRPGFENPRSAREAVHGRQGGGGREFRGLALTTGNEIKIKTAPPLPSPARSS